MATILPRNYGIVATLTNSNRFEAFVTLRDST
jgi:hypothetical protein